MLKTLRCINSPVLHMIYLSKRSTHTMSTQQEQLSPQTVVSI
uniref:Uncharacterized protein n=1 Tax=Arundo donax TaxID=35708 RepID=A0A0A8ZGA6_ARUDO